MIKQSMLELNRAKGNLASDVNAVITDGEELLKAAAAVSGDGFAAARVKFEERLGSARTRLATVSRSTVDKTRETAAAADEYVHANPWAAIGIAAGAGMVIGFLAARR